MKPGDHPEDLLDFFRRALAQAFALEFSRYVYRPRSTEDNREYFTVDSAQARERFHDLVAGLKPEQDLALHSTVKAADGSMSHIPMLDLIGKFDSAWAEPIGKLMRVFGVEEFAVYSTGRSAHVYGLGLLPASAVTHFFGRALLLNLPDEAPIVDFRWVGHRLIAGYGSLRWSCNGPQYLQAPQLIGKFS